MSNDVQVDAPTCEVCQHRAVPPISISTPIGGRLIDGNIDAIAYTRVVVCSACAPHWEGFRVDDRDMVQCVDCELWIPKELSTRPIDAVGPVCFRCGR